VLLDLIEGEAMIQGRSVRVVDLSELPSAVTAADDHPSTLVVDATRPTDLPVTVLARLVRIRRAVRAGGGDLVLVARAPVAHLLLRTGLLFSLPCFETVPDAIGAVDAAA
jgi:hypothetical protein